MNLKTRITKLEQRTGAGRPFYYMTFATEAEYEAALANGMVPAGVKCYIGTGPDDWDEGIKVEYTDDWPPSSGAASLQGAM